MTVGYEALLFAAVVDVLKAECAAFSIPVDPLRVYQANIPSSNNQLPAAVVRLPTNHDESDWKTTGNKKDSIFKVEIRLGCEIPPDGDHPYGDSTHPGILTLSADIKNAIENNITAFREASGQMVDFQTTSTVLVNEAGTIGEIAITVAFIVRYVAGAR